MNIIQSDDFNLSGPSFVLGYKKALEIKAKKKAKADSVKAWWNNNLNQIIVFFSVLVVSTIYIAAVLGN